MNAAIPSAVMRYTLADIAAATGISKRGAEKRAAKERWICEEVAVRGGRQKLFALTDLPKEVAEKVFLHKSGFNTQAPAPIINAVPIDAPAATNIVLRGAPEGLSSGQLDCERARKCLVDFIGDFVGAVDRAIDRLNADFYAGTLPSHLAWAMNNAWGKTRKDRRLNRRTYYNWVRLSEARGRLAPKRSGKDMSVKPWYPLLLELRQRPQGSSIKWVAETIANNWNQSWGEKPPSYFAVQRVCKQKLSAIDQLKGRFTGSQLRAHKHWNPRTSEGMVPWQEIHADGWNTHFKAPHPVTGEFVTYEVWHFHDVATRLVTPPGIGLTETYEVVTAGLERCVRFGGMPPIILQTDSTGVIKGSEKFGSLADRAGITVVHPVVVGNSQANGIAENFNTWLDREARELATYQAKGMDSLTFKRVNKITEKMVKAEAAGDLDLRDQLRKKAERVGKGLVFTSYAQAVDWINSRFDKWNYKPHRALPKITDPATGNRRHQTPMEAFHTHLENGWKPAGISEDHIVDLFRPHIRCKVSRGAVSPVGNGQRYAYAGLDAHNGEYVSVAVDPMDWATVWVKTLEGELLGIADLIKASGYRAKTTYEIAREKNVNAQLRRNEIKADKIKARAGGLVVEAPRANTVIIGSKAIDINKAVDAVVVNRASAIEMQTGLSSTRAEQAVKETPRSQRPPEENYAEWLDIDTRMNSGEPVSDKEQRWHVSYQRTPQFFAMSKKKAAA